MQPYTRDLKQMFRKSVERSVPMMIQSPYKQIASSFIIGNRDRFGDPYVPLKPMNNIPGPGAYNLPDQFNK